MQRATRDPLEQAIDTAVQLEPDEFFFVCCGPAPARRGRPPNGFSHGAATLTSAARCV